MALKERLERSHTRAVARAESAVYRVQVAASGAVTKGDFPGARLAALEALSDLQQPPDASQVWRQQQISFGSLATRSSNDSLTASSNSTPNAKASPYLASRALRLDQVSQLAAPHINTETEQASLLRGLRHGGCSLLSRCCRQQMRLH